MDNEKFSQVWLAVFGAGMIALGIVLLSCGMYIFGWFTSLLGALSVVSGVHRIIKAFSGKKSIGPFVGIGLIATGIFILFNPNMTFGFITFMFSLCLFLNTLVKIIDLFASIRNKTKDIWADFAEFLFFLIFAVIMLFTSFMGPEGMLIVSGIYCILYGANQIGLFVRNLIPVKTQKAVKRRLRVALPLFISSFIPLRVLKKYNRHLDERNIERQTLLIENKNKADGREPNIHVMIHVSDDGVGMMGHCDIRMGDLVISYGNYDAKSSGFLGGVGDGVMFEADFGTYVRFSVENDKQMIFDYGLYLNETQLENVNEEIARIRKNIYEWKPPYCIAKETNPDANINDFKDYGSILWNGTHARFYKFKSGKFKSYCVMSTNCVLLADSILSKASTDIVDISGIISPGAYYDYLQSEYNLENGIVITRDIYCKENMPM